MFCFFVIQDICSILEASLNEDRELMNKIWVGDIYEEIADVVAEGIMGHLSARKKVFWKNLYKRDVAGRAEERKEEEVDQEEADPLNPPLYSTSLGGEMWESMKTMMEAGFSSILSRQDKVDNMLGKVSDRLLKLEEEVETLKKNTKGKDKVEETGDGVDEETDYGVYGEGTSAGRDNFGCGEGNEERESEVKVQPSPVSVPCPLSPEVEVQPSPVAAVLPSLVSDPCPPGIPEKRKTRSSAESQASPVAKKRKTRPSTESQPSPLPEKRKTIPSTESQPSPLPEKWKTIPSRFQQTPYTVEKKKKNNNKRGKKGNRSNKGDKRNKKKKV